MKNKIISECLVESLRKHWVKILGIIVVGFIVLGFPPGFPFGGTIEIDTDKQYYDEGEMVNAAFYLVNPNPWPLRIQPYRTVDVYATHDGENVRGGYSADIDYVAGASIYVPPNSRHKILMNSSFKTTDAGSYNIVVKLSGGSGVFLGGEKTVLVQEPVVELSDFEKELVDEALRIALIDEKIPDFELLTRNDPIILSNKNLGDYVPSLDGINILVMMPQEIFEKAEASGNFLHLEFKDISASTSSGIVKLDNIWVSGVSDGIGRLSGGGFTLYIYRLDDGFGYEKSSGWIS